MLWYSHYTGSLSWTGSVFFCKYGGSSYHLPEYLHRGAACHLTFYIPYLDVFHVIVPASLPIPR